jgi:hypothetical protein
MTLSSNLTTRLSQNLRDFEAAFTRFYEIVPLSTDWIQRDWLLADGNKARALLAGAKVALLETGTAWAIGSNRGAASSLRAYIESSFAWLYYKDHPVELKAVLVRQMDMLLPKAIQSYLGNVDHGFERSYSNLVKRKRRTNEYFYTDVSQFVHAHPSITLGSVDVESAAVSVPRDDSFLVLSQMADEFISDNYLAMYRASWGDVPTSVQSNAQSRMGSSALKQFVDTI